MKIIREREIKYHKHIKNSNEMNCCYKHTDRPAVATCGKCGKVICNECADKSEYTWDNKPMCRDCNRQLIQEMLSIDKKETWKLSITIGVLFFVLLFAATFWFVEKDSSLVCSILFIAGIIPAWKLTRLNQRERELESLKDSVSGDPGSRMFGRFVGRLLVALVVAVIMPPILFVRDIYKLIMVRKESRLLKQQYQALEME